MAGTTGWLYAATESDVEEISSDDSVDLLELMPEDNLDEKDEK